MRCDQILGAAVLVLVGGWIGGAGAQNEPAAPAGGTIHLHMPGAQTDSGTIRLHPIHSRAPAAATDATDTLPAATNAVPAARTKASHLGGAAGKAAIPFNFGEDDAAPPADGGPAPGAPAPVVPQPSLKTASIPPHAGATTHGSNDEHAGLTKRGAVMFEKGATNPSPAQFNGVKLLAGDLTTALESGASRIQLEAYGGAAGDKSSDARRLSLKRALAVRQLLIDNGVPSNRIDVRAMGGVDDKGPTDRVDVFLRAG